MGVGVKCVGEHTKALGTDLLLFSSAAETRDSRSVQIVEDRKVLFKCQCDNSQVDP